MGEERTQRHLAAILAADVVGYSRLMERDEAGTLAVLKSLRTEVFEPQTRAHGGRIFKINGDGALCEFASAVDAVRAALEVQRALVERNAGLPDDRRIALRIGIALGDVLAEGGDLYGHGVNLAARIEGLAEPGGVCVAGNVAEHLQTAGGFTVADMGEHQLKNIERPIRVFRVAVAGAPDTPAARPALALPDKPSIAVLAFQNMSGDPEQEYFVDGLVEDIITALSRIRWLFVIARNSSFTYKGEAVDVKQVGRELGVRYVLEGSVRKAANRVRITGQLIDATSGAHLWADRYDGQLADVFDLQDSIAASVVGVIEPTMEAAEIARARGKRPDSLDAYDCYLRALPHMHAQDRPGNNEAMRLLRRAIELDANFATPYGLLSWCYSLRRSQGWVADYEAEKQEAVRLARAAARLGKDDSMALHLAGLCLSHFVREHDEAMALIAAALQLNPSSAGAWARGGWVRCFRGEPEEAMRYFEQSMRLNPRDPFPYLNYAGGACACALADRNEEAVGWATKAVRDNPNYVTSFRYLALAYVQLGRLEEARATMRRVLELDPTLTVALYRQRMPLVGPMAERLFDALRTAGLPEG